LARADAKGQGAEGSVRRGVTIAANNRLARLRDAKSRADHVHDALLGTLHIEKQNSMLAAIAFERFKLRGSYMVCHRQVTVLGRHGVVITAKVRSGRRTLRPATLRPEKACG